MNILQIRIGNCYDSDYSEFLFHTNRPQSDFYDCNFHLTPWFEDWLITNNKLIIDKIRDGHIDEICYYNNESIDIIY